MIDRKLRGSQGDGTVARNGMSATDTVRLVETVWLSRLWLNRLVETVWWSREQFGCRENSLVIASIVLLPENGIVATKTVSLL